MRFETAIPIGRGAVGEVYKAWDPRLNRHVALKLLQRNDPELVLRLSREAQAQARVEHPNVGKIYEVGEEDGRPYIAMQLIEGRTFDEICPELSLEQRVAVLERVADAVQAAHRVGLVHRDLKPSNILVEVSDDGEPNPFVVDFGIARELDAEGLTQTGMAIGTPGYMAPEQARGEREIDRRIDVYALGVLLYEAVSGERPHPQSTLADYLVAVLAEEPRPLRRLAPDVPVDLETIAMKCIEREPNQRYGSARMVAEELTRFLEGEPVIARPIGTVRRLVRRARRNRVATAALLILVVALAAGAIKYTLDLRRERGLAVAARADAEELLEFMLNDLYESLTSIGRVDLLEQVARRSLDYYQRNPPSGAAAAHRRGLAYKNVARVLESQRDVDEALRAFAVFQRYFEDLVARGDQNDGSNPPSTRHLENRFQLATGGLLGAELLHSQGRVDEAVERYRFSLATLDELIGSSPQPPRSWRRARARALTDLGWASREAGDTEGAAASYEDALAELSRLTDDASPDDDPESFHQLSATLSDVGYLAIASDRLQDARAPYERALEIALALVEAQPGNRRWDYELVLVRGRLGYLEDLLERPREALAQYELGAQRAQRLVEWDPANGDWLRELAFCRSSAGDMLYELGRHEEALRQFEESLEISSRLRDLAPSSASAANDYAYELIQIGKIQETLGRGEAALEHRERALAALQPFVDERSDSYCVETAAGVLLDLGRTEEATVLIRDLRGENWHAPELFARADALGI